MDNISRRDCEYTENEERVPRAIRFESAYYQSPNCALYWSKTIAEYMVYDTLLLLERLFIATLCDARGP